MSKKFLYGASTASYQLDGAGDSITQWGVFERQNADSLAKSAKKTFSYNPKFPKFWVEASNPHNYIVGKGIEHRKNYRDDLNLLKSLGLKAFRFSVEWARIEPRQNEFSFDEIENLRKYIRAIRAAKMEPVMTLWHWTMPTWFTDMGGFEKVSNIPYFTKFCKLILDEMKGEVSYIITLNETVIYAHNSYSTGNWPPNKRRPFLSLKVINNLAIAHNQIYRLAKKINPDYKLSVSHNSSSIISENTKLKTRGMVAFRKYEQDYLFLDRIVHHLDFLGVNWYNCDHYFGAPLYKNPNKIISDLGWNAEPREIHFSLERLYKRYKLPILITENGLADADDELRKWWIDETFAGLKIAKENGVDIFGYLHWSAFDNFEWDKGFWPRFGLIEIKKDLTRKIRPSAKHYAKLIKNDIMK